MKLVMALLTLIPLAAMADGAERQKARPVGAGLQNASRQQRQKKHQANLRRRATVTPGATLSMRAKFQVWYKWGKEGAVAVSEEAVELQRAECAASLRP